MLDAEGSIPNAEEVLADIRALDGTIRARIVNRLA